MTEQARVELLQKKIEEYRLEELIPPRHYPQVRYLELPKGTHLFRQNEPAEYFYIMLRGSGRLYQILGNGKSTTNEVVTGFCLLGDMEMLCDKPTLNSFQLLEAGEFLRLPMDYCRREMIGEHGFLKALAAHRARALYTVEANNYVALAFPFEGQLANYILSLQKETFALDLRILPEQFGATYRHFLRVVKKLCEEGAIEKQGKLYRIKDRSALERKVYE